MSFHCLKILTLTTFSDQNSATVFFGNKTKLFESTLERFTYPKSVHEDLSDKLSTTPVQFVSSWSWSWCSKVPLPKCSLSCIKNQEKQNCGKPFIALSTYNLRKLVCKILYQWTDKYGTHKHLDAYTALNATFSKSKIGLKMDFF